MASDPAQAAFNKAVKLLDGVLSEDSALRQFLSGHADIVSVHSAVVDAQRQYEHRTNSKARKWMTRLSTRLHLYGEILDVFVEHHPEYVALAWGTFKLLFVGVVNHEELTKELGKAFCRIADALPQTERDLLLYPSDAMKELVETLYANIIDFAQRAIQWYAEGKVKHAVSALVRPYSLRFKDIVNEVSETSRRIERLAHSMSRTELRQARLELLENRNELQQMRKEHKDTQDVLMEMKLLLEHTNQRLSQVQLSQILTFTACSSLPTPEECRRLYHPKKLRRHEPYEEKPMVQYANQLQNWSANPKSSQIAVCASSRCNNRTVRGFGIDAIELIANANVPVVWALTPRIHSTKEHTSINVLKHLVSQAIQRNTALHNERAVTMSAVRFQTAVTEREWFDLLASVLDGISQIYIIIDMSILDFDSDTEEPWPMLFNRMFEELAARRLQITVKVAFICQSFRQKGKLGDSEEVQKLSLSSPRSDKVRSNRVTKSHRKPHSGHSRKKGAIF
ncbi:MAG: hypothetical protein Q9157_004869 [Trypethelium eluteriae]